VALERYGAGRRLEDLADASVAPLARLRTEAQRAGSVRADLGPETTASFLVNAWEGALIRARADRSSKAFHTFFEIVFGTLLAP
jgi:TetR/AcrR family transcriptional repressor of nem operon